MKYTVKKKKKKATGGKFIPRTLTAEERADNKGLKFLRDELTGEILKAPERDRTKPFPRADTRDVAVRAEACDRAWEDILRYFHGDVAVPEIMAELRDGAAEAKAREEQAQLVQVKSAFYGKPWSIRSYGVIKRPWRKARGDADWLERQAAFYLECFDHEQARFFDRDAFILLKVVCNVRNYYGMTQEQTVNLVRSHFNPKSNVIWTQEAIALAWELVENYTPWLGLNDPRAIAERHQREVEEEVKELLAFTRAGGRVNTEDFYRMFKDWFPDLEAGKGTVSKAVHEITGKVSVPYREGRCYPGFHFPTAEELIDPQHQPGPQLTAMGAPLSPAPVVPLIPLMAANDAGSLAS